MVLRLLAAYKFVDAVYLNLEETPRLVFPSIHVSNDITSELLATHLKAAVLLAQCSCLSTRCDIR